MGQLCDDGSQKDDPFPSLELGFGVRVDPGVLRTKVTKSNWNRFFSFNTAICMDLTTIVNGCTLLKTKMYTLIVERFLLLWLINTAIYTKSASVLYVLCIIIEHAIFLILIYAVTVRINFKRLELIYAVRNASVKKIYDIFDIVISQ